MAHWALQANPSRFRILKAAFDLDEISWIANQFADQIQVGDQILTWISGPNSGGYALGEVIAAAKEMLEDPPSISYWLSAGTDDDAKSLPRIRVRFTRRMYLYPLLRTQCKEDPVLSQMHIMRQPAGTIFKITDEQWARVQESLGAHPPEWTREEMVLILAHRLDAKAKRFHEPQAAVVARLARLMDRDAKHVGNAIGAFTYLDPESKGKGLVNATDEMKAIWVELGARPDDVRQEAERIQTGLLGGGGLVRLRETSVPIAVGAKAAERTEHRKEGGDAIEQQPEGRAHMQEGATASTLTLVKSQEEVRASIARFNQDALQTRDRIRTLCRATTYWIFDPTIGKFGPGNTSRRTVERVFGMEFRVDPQMAVMLRAWGDALLGAGAFESGRGEDRWKFVALPSNSPKHWKIAPGEKAAFWKENRDSGLIAIGWGQAGDPRAYKNTEDLVAHYRKVFPYTKEQAQRSVTAVRWFIRDINPGDIIVANQGMSKVMGRGVVLGPAEFRTKRGEYGNCLPVHWFNTREREIPKQSSWFSTILPMNADVYEALFGSAGSGEGEDEGHPESAVDEGSEPEKRASIYDFLRDCGLHFPVELVTTYLLSLKTKPFVILSGISGTGKTKLAQTVAEWAGAEVREVEEEAPQEPASSAWLYELKPYNFSGGTAYIPRDKEALFDLPPEGTIPLEVQYSEETYEGRLGAVRANGRPLWQVRFGKALTAILANDLSPGDYVVFSVDDDNGKQTLRIERVGKERRTRKEMTYRHEFISVRPDWLDGKEVLGFYNVLTEDFTSRPFLNLLLRAHREPERPHFVILDEMNLARVEHYFADLLSVTESRILHGTKLRQEALHLHDERRCLPLTKPEGWELPGRCALCKATEQEVDACRLHFDGVQMVPPRFKVPPNVYVTGTVNIDETTHMFSPKVLDRGNVIEFNEVDLLGYGKDVAPTAFVLKDGQIDLRTSTVARQEDFVKAPEQIRNALTALNQILAEYNLHFGYRVANEIALYVTSAAEYVGPDAIGTALDLQVLQKVLPKFHGSKQKLLPPLWRVLLFTVFGRDFEAAEYKDDEFKRIAVGIATVKPVTPPEGGEAVAAVMPRSAAKLVRMLRTLRAQGFVSFIE